MSRILIGLFAGSTFGCAAPAQPLDTAPDATAKPKVSAEPENQPEQVQRPPLEPKETCTGFEFQLGEQRGEDSTPPNADDPVSHDSWSQMLSLRFTCGAQEKTEPLLELQFYSHGAYGGCAYSLSTAGELEAQNYEGCDGLSIEEALESGFDQVLGTPQSGVVESLVIVTDAGRAYMNGVERFDVRMADSGFEVTHTDGEDPPKVIFRHGTADAEIGRPN